MKLMKLVDVQIKVEIVVTDSKGRRIEKADKKSLQHQYSKWMKESNRKIHWLCWQSRR